MGAENSKSIHTTATAPHSSDDDPLLSMNGLMVVAIMGVLPPLPQGWVRSGGTKGADVFNELISRNEVVACVMEEVPHHLPFPYPTSAPPASTTSTTTIDFIPLSLLKDPPATKVSLWDELFATKKANSTAITRGGGSWNWTLIYNCSASMTAWSNGLHHYCSLEALSKKTHITKVQYLYGGDVVDVGGGGFAAASSSSSSSSPHHLTSIDNESMGLCDVSRSTRLVALKTVEHVDFDEGFNNIKSIGKGFLTDFTRLKTIDLSPFRNTTSIGGYFLYSCMSLPTIDLSPLSNVEVIGEVFLGACRSLTTLDLTPLGRITKIPSQFLFSCDKLEKVDISTFTNVRSVEGCFMASCGALTSIDLHPFQSSLVEVGPSFLGNCWNLQSINLTPLQNVTIIKEKFLWSCQGLEVIDLTPLRNATSIWAEFLANCRKVRSLDLSPLTGIHSIGDGWMTGCTSLETVILPHLRVPPNPTTALSSATSPDPNFATTSSAPILTTPPAGTNITPPIIIGHEFMNNCSKIKSIDFTPLKNVTSIGNKFMYLCSSLSVVDITPLANVTAIGASFLGGCDRLQTVHHDGLDDGVIGNHIQELKLYKK